jgi:kynurenine formamidase
MIELNETWDVGRLIDLGCDYYNGMPDMPKPLPSFRLRECDKEMEELCRHQPFRSYTQEVRMCVQCGNYLETGAHLYPEMESIAEVGLERLFVSAVVLRIPKRKDEKVTADDLQTALKRSRETIHPGDAILVAVGYDRFGTNDADAVNTPHFSYSGIEWCVKRKPSIIASDMASWYDGQEEPNFWPMLQKSGSLVIGSLRNVKHITSARIRLVALPMKIRGACAAPCRIVAILPSQSPSRKPRLRVTASGKSTVSRGR